MIKYITIFLSYVLGNYISSLMKIESLFIIVSLVSTYPLFKDNKRFILTCFICGYIYDLVITNTLFISTISFGICAYLIIILSHYLKPSIYNGILKVIIVLMCYRFSHFIVLFIIGYTKLNLFDDIIPSTLINALYSIFLLFIIKKAKKYCLKKY